MEQRKKNNRSTNKFVGSNPTSAASEGSHSLPPPQSGNGFGEIDGNTLLHKSPVLGRAGRKGSEELIRSLC